MKFDRPRHGFLEAYDADIARYWPVWRLEQRYGFLGPAAVTRVLLDGLPRWTGTGTGTGSMHSRNSESESDNGVGVGGRAGDHVSIYARYTVTAFKSWCRYTGVPLFHFPGRTKEVPACVQELLVQRRVCPLVY
jgi:hypothetical protein